MSSQKSENWILEAEDMQIKSRAHRAESILLLNGIEKLLDADDVGTLSEDSQSEEEYDSEGDVSKNLDMFTEDDDDIPSVPFEKPPAQGEEERTEIPMWLQVIARREAKNRD